MPRDTALKIVAGVEKAFGDRDIDVILAGFTDDVVVRFADQPELRVSGVDVPPERTGGV